MSIDMSRDDMLSALREGVVSLSFEKVKDGLIREMKATLVSDRIPADKMPKGGSVDQSVGGDATLRVFDTDIQEWRSFSVDKVLTFETA
mgnify:CR=1 FL=1